MKSIQAGRRIVSDNFKETLETDIVVSAGFASVLALCVVMFVGLYSWSGHAPIFLSRGTSVPIQQTMPWMP